MKTDIFSDWKRYNANTNNKNVGDCVKRGLSVAYSMDYNDVGKELNAIKRKSGFTKFNIFPVFDKFVQKRGDKFVSCNETITVGEFSEIYNSGVYLILCGSEPGQMSHLTVVVDGDFYDSWNSSDYYVYKYAVVSNGKSGEYEIDYEELSLDCVGYLIDYAENKLNSKYREFFYVYLSYDDFKQIDKYTYQVMLVFNFEDFFNAPSEVVRSKWNKIYSRGSSNGGEPTIVGKRVIFKFNPRMSGEDNYKSITNKAKTQLYNYVRRFGEAFLNEIAGNAVMDKVPERHGYIDYDELAKLPEECYSDVYEYFPKTNMSEYYFLQLQDRYTGEIITFSFDYLRDLKKAIKHYYATGEVLSDY